MALALLADLSQILAEVFLEPDANHEEGLTELLSGSVSPALLPPLETMSAMAMAPDEQPVEYTRLFLHAKDTDTIHLFESVQARGHHMAPEVLGPLKAIYDGAEISLQDGLGIPPDHLGLELACLAFLLNQVLESSPEDRAHFKQLALTLLREHLRPFTTVVKEQLSQVQAHPFYLSAGALAADLVSETEKALAKI